MLRLGLLLGLLLSGCSKGSPKLPQPVSPVKAADYLPLAAGTSLSFRGGTGIGTGPVEEGKQDWDVAASTAPDGQPGFAVSLRGRGLLNAMVMQVGVRPEGIVSWQGAFGLAKTEFTPPFVELPETITPGMKWSWSGTSKGISMQAESVLEGLEKIQVPAGEYLCLRIRRTIGPSTVTHWYAQGLGMVRVEMRNPGGQIRLARDK